MNNRNQAIIKLKEQGLSYAQIAIAYGISRQRVCQICKKKLTNSATQKSPQTDLRASRKGIKKVLCGITGVVKETEGMKP